MLLVISTISFLLSFIPCLCSVEYSVPLGNGSSTINTSRVWGPEQTPEGGEAVIILVRYHLRCLF